MNKIIVFLYILILFLTACSNYKSSQQVQLNNKQADLETIPNNKIIDKSQETILESYKIDSSCRNLVVEIVDEQYGMVLPQGKLLNIRVLRNGDAEYDYYENPNAIERKKIKLADFQQDYLLKFANFNKTDFSKLEYSDDESCLDAVFRKQITFCPSLSGPKKEILIKECRTSDSDSKEKIPSQILELTKYINKIKKS